MENLKFNILFLEWFLKRKEITKDDVDRLYHMFMFAYNEDVNVFLKIALYIAGNRKKYQETHYKCILHFLATNYPEKIMSNLHLFLKFGHITDILYLRQEPVIAKRIETFIKYHASFVDIYKKIFNNEIINQNTYEKFFKFKIKNNNYERFFDKLLNDINLNLII